MQLTYLYHSLFFQNPRKNYLGTSLVTHCLRLHAAKGGAERSTLGQGAKTLYKQAKKPKPKPEAIL